MAQRKNKKQARPKRAQIEKFYDYHDQDVEEHVLPLLSKIGSVEIEKFSLTTPESAAQAIPMLDEVIEKLSTYRKAAFTLRQLLEEKRERTSEE